MRLKIGMTAMMAAPLCIVLALALRMTEILFLGAGFIAVTMLCLMLDIWMRE